MNLENVVLVLGSRKALAKANGVSNSVVTSWGDFNLIPHPYRAMTKKALRERKRVLDKAYKELMK